MKQTQVNHPFYFQNIYDNIRKPVPIESEYGRQKAEWDLIENKNSLSPFRLLPTIKKIISII
jgi:hypothetical protein